MQNNGYARAFNVWDDMLMTCRKQGQRKMKSRIAYNMAIACEFQNRLDEAVKWAEQSVRYSENMYNASYVELLKKRQEQAILLDKQIDR